MFVYPMRLEYAKENKPFNDKRYISELKLDGIRLLVTHMDRVRLYTRHNNEITANFPELVKSIPIPKGTILDGEMIVSDTTGKPNFEAVNERFKSNKSKHKITFCAFDVIRYKDRDTKSLKLLERKELLEESFEENDFYVKSKFIEGHGIDYFERVKQLGLEGIVLKKNDSLYVPGKKSSSWLKVIAYEMNEVFIAGYLKNEFGWLLSDGERIIGVAEYGPDSDHKKAFYKIAQQLKTNENKDVVYVQPRIKCIVKHRGITKNKMLRLPVFEHFVV